MTTTPMAWNRYLFWKGRSKAVQPYLSCEAALRYLHIANPSSTAPSVLDLGEIPISTTNHLRQHGYAILDNFLPSKTCRSIVNEIEYLCENSYAVPNATHLVQGRTQKSFRKQNVLQSELSTISTTALSAIPILQAFSEDRSLNGYLSVHWPSLTLTQSSVKVLRSDRKACFPVHVDASKTLDNRMVTAVIYPHSNWNTDDGGQLRIYPDPLSFVDIEPLPGRLVLTSSRGIHHRVLSTEFTRYAVAVWLSGSLRSKHFSLGDHEYLSIPAQVALGMLAPKFRDYAFRLVLEHEWKQSLREAHGVEEAKLLIDDFDKGLEQIRSIVPSAVCQSIGVTNQVAKIDVEQLFMEKDGLKNGFEELQKEIGQLPFLW